MAINNKLTESKFNAIKILLKGGASIKEAAGYMQVGEATISRVKQAETWEEYVQQTAARALAAREYTAKKTAAASKPEPAPAPAQPAKVIHESSVTIQATHYMTEELRKINETLALISNKLAYIVDQLT